MQMSSTFPALNVKMTKGGGKKSGGKKSGGKKGC